MTAKELHDRLQTTEGWSALPAAWKALLEDFDAALGDAQATNTRLNRRCQLAEAAANQNVEACHRQGMSLGRSLAHYAAAEAEEARNALATQLAECHEALDVAIAPVDVGGGEKVAASNLAKQLAECRAELADYRAWYECRVHPESPMVCGDILHLESRIEARRAKEAER